MKNISFYNAVEKIKGLIQKSRKYGFKGFNFKNQDAYTSMIFKTLDIVRVFEKYDENEKNHFMGIHPALTSKSIDGILIKENGFFKAYLHDKNTILTISGKLENNTFKNLEYGIDAYNFSDWAGLAGKVLA